ncbi:MAG TPA: hypothetical protein VE734_10420 [Terriglobales bacterium]|jgi:hypothetical protein|nr:hypothetical protein [Terriglobales bacterium]
MVAVTCRICGKARDPREFVHDAITGYCWHCYEHHLEALRALAEGTPPAACHVCGVSTEALRAAQGGADVRMYMHPKDGIYQVLCPGCSDRYERKATIYDNTPYGWRKKLKGKK